jgi:hypothetical protein
MKADSHDLASLDRLIAEGKARAALYRGEPRASRHLAKDPPLPPPVPPPPSPPPSFPRESLSSATARFILSSAARARGVEPGDDQPGNPPDPSHGDDGARDKPKKEPPDPEHDDDDDQKNAAPGDLILRAIRRRRGK